MATAISARPHDEGILACLKGGGHKVGDHQAPADGGSTVDPPYAMYFRLDSGEFEGSLEDPEADVVLEFQVSSVGVTPEQAAVLDDLLRQRFLNEALTVTGRSVSNRVVVGIGAVLTNRSRDGFRYTVPSRYSIKTTPA